MTLNIESSIRYFGILTTLQNKVVGDANDILTNHGTVLIQIRLIPNHVIAQEISVLRQGSKSLIDYYKKVI